MKMDLIIALRIKIIGIKIDYDYTGLKNADATRTTTISSEV